GRKGSELRRLRGNAGEQNDPGKAFQRSEKVETHCSSPIIDGNSKVSLQNSDFLTSTGFDNDISEFMLALFFRVLFV
ncbi:MAG TPA: hypothetical protein PLC40_08460, partial [Candidatus Hydrogenedentes bacterium]|nr:hypothetical protein [Candidatus Hydrogenedentota bacterium]